MMMRFLPRLYRAIHYAVLSDPMEKMQQLCSTLWVRSCFTLLLQRCHGGFNFFIKKRKKKKSHGGPFHYQNRLVAFWWMVGGWALSFKTFLSIELGHILFFVVAPPFPPVHPWWTLFQSLEKQHKIREPLPNFIFLSSSVFLAQFLWTTLSLNSLCLNDYPWSGAGFGGKVQVLYQIL